jgi:hypothetical protein
MKRMSKEEKEAQAIENKQLLVSVVQEEIQKKRDDNLARFHNSLTEVIGSSELPIIEQIAIFRMIEQELLDVAFKKYPVK